MCRAEPVGPGPLLGGLCSPPALPLLLSCFLRGLRRRRTRVPRTWRLGPTHRPQAALSSPGSRPRRPPAPAWVSAVPEAVPSWTHHPASGLHGVRLPTRGETATVSRLARQDEGATKGPRRRYGSGTRRASRRSSPGWVTRFPGRRVPRGRPSACSRESPRRLSWGFRVLIF